MDPVSLAIVSALALLLLAALFERIGRTGQVKNAIDTITILRAQVDTYKDENALLRSRVDQLESALSALKEMVTQAAPIQELKIMLQAHDRQTSEALGRIEAKVNGKATE